MYDFEQIQELRKEIIDERIVSIRLRLAGILFVLLYWVCDYKSLFNSMNVEVGPFTKATMATSSWLCEWWFIAIPLLWIGWRKLEDGCLTSLSPRHLRYVASALFILAFGIILSVQMPMLKLINNVG